MLVWFNSKCICLALILAKNHFFLTRTEMQCSVVYAQATHCVSITKTPMNRSQNMVTNLVTHVFDGTITWTSTVTDAVDTLKAGFTFTPNAATALPVDNKVFWFHFESSLVEGQNEENEKFARVSLRGKLSEKDSTKTYEFKWKNPYAKVDPKRKVNAKDINGLEEFVKLTQLVRAKVTVTWHHQPVVEEVRYCNCQVNEESRPKGEIVVFHTFFLPDFFRNPAAGSWEKVEAQMDLAEKLTEHYLKDATGLGKNKPDDANGGEYGFTAIREREKRLITDGDDFSIFKHRLHNNCDYPRSEDNRRWLTDKAYRLRKKVRTIDGTTQPINGNAEASIKVRLTRNHVIEIIERIPIEETYIKKKKAGATGEINLKGLIKFLLRFRHPGVSEHYSDSVVPGNSADIKEIAFSFVDQLFQSCKDKDKELDKPDRANVRRERQRYVVLLLSRVSCNACNNKAIKPDKLHDSDLFSNLMDGTLNFKNSPETSSLPSIKRTDAAKENLFTNFATWDNELCVFGPERAVIYYTPQTVLFGRRRVADYRDYWHCILRGIGLAVTLKTVLHLLETHSAKATRDIPDLTSQKYDGRKAQLLVKRTGYIQKYLPWVREVSLASSAFREDQVIRKFDFLFEKCFRFSNVLSHIQQNIDELSQFMQYFKGRELSINTTRIAVFFSVMGLFLTVLASYYALPSFIDSASKFCKGGCFEYNDTFFGLVFLGAFLLVHLTGTIYYIVVHQKYLKRDFDSKSWPIISAAILILVLNLIMFGYVYKKYSDNRDVIRPEEKPASQDQ